MPIYNPPASSGGASVTVSAPLDINGQAIRLVNDQNDQVTEIDTGVLVDSDMIIPSSKAVKTAIAGIGPGMVLYWHILSNETVNVLARTQYPIFNTLKLEGALVLEDASELVLHL